MTLFWKGQSRNVDSWSGFRALIMAHAQCFVIDSKHNLKARLDIVGSYSKREERKEDRGKWISFFNRSSKKVSI